MICAECHFETVGPGVRFCKNCGQPLWHACPHPGCGQPVETGTAESVARLRCPWCRGPLLQCEVCHWIALPGAERCVNPQCPPGSLMGAPTPHSCAGGNPARSGEHRFEMAVGEHDPLPAWRYALAGRVAGVAAGRGSLLAALRDGRLLVFGLPNWAEPPGEPKRMPLPARLPDLPDALATNGDRLHVLTDHGAWTLESPDPAAARAQVAGSFVAQVATEAGWLLVEAARSGCRLHRRGMDGSDRGLEPVAAPTALASPEWLLPAADNDAAYWADAAGQAWRLPWSGGGPEPVGPPTGAPSTVMLVDHTIYVLPIVRGGNAARIDAGGRVATFPVSGRNALAAAASPGPRERRLWLGTDGADRVRAVEMDLPSQSAAVAGTSDEVRQIATIRRPDGSTDMICLLVDQGVYLRGWRDEPPYDRKMSVSATGPSQPEAAARLTLADPWACLSYNAGGQALFTFNLLS